MKELLNNDVFKDTTSSIKSVVKSGAKGAAIWAKFQTIITLLISMVIYSVIIWLSFKYIVNVDYLQLEGTVVSCDCEDKQYTTTTKDSKTGDTNTSTGTTTTCTTTFSVIVPEEYKSQGLLVMKYINANNNTNNSSLKSLNATTYNGTDNSTNNFACAMIIGSNIIANRACTTFVNNLTIRDIPSSSIGLPTGSVWKNGTVLEIVP